MHFVTLTNWQNFDNNFLTYNLRKSRFIKYRSSAFISKEYVGCKMKLDDFPNSLHLIRLVLSVCRTTQLCDLATTTRECYRNFAKQTLFLGKLIWSSPFREPTPPPPAIVFFVPSVSKFCHRWIILQLSLSLSLVPYDDESVTVKKIRVGRLGGGGVDVGGIIRSRSRSSQLWRGGNGVLYCFH